MKYIKTFEGIDTQELKRGDIILMNHGSSESLNLILEDTYEPNKKIKAFFIGTLDYNYSHKKYISLVYNTKDNNVFIKYNNKYRFLTDEEKKLFYEALFMNNVNRYVDNTKIKTGIDLKELEKEGYEEYIIDKDVNKYNL